jgi:hypothetical protein
VTERRRVHLERDNGRAYCGHKGAEMTRDPELATCLACLRRWRQEREREAKP